MRFRYDWGVVFYVETTTVCVNLPRLPLKLTNPCLGPSEGVSVSDIVDNDGSLGAPIVHGRQGMISFLSGSVPDLKFDRRVVETNGLGEECGSDRRFLKFVELSFHEPEDEGRFADGGFTQKNQLKLGKTGCRTSRPWIGGGSCCCRTTRTHFCEGSEMKVFGVTSTENPMGKTKNTKNFFSRRGGWSFLFSATKTDPANALTGKI
jgi:hypothetical protein